jgi:hypothetical protein
LDYPPLLRQHGHYGRLYMALDSWSIDSDRGKATINPGLIFTDADNVIPDVVLASNERLNDSLDEAGHLTAAPEISHRNSLARGSK